jgi:hypothetical protein
MRLIFLFILIRLIFFDNLFNTYIYTHINTRPNFFCFYETYIFYNGVNFALSTTSQTLFGIHSLDNGKIDSLRK